MAIENILEDFVSSKEAGAIVLRGPWGVGKTYLWQHRVVSKLLEKPWKKRYSYVSLFGLNSLSELKVAVAVATEEFDSDARRQWRLTGSMIRFFWRVWRWASDLVAITPKSGLGLSRVFDRVGFYLVRDRIVCFDDVERHGKQLDMKDFLGLVSYLAEQRSCRVVVILNDGQLGPDQATWDDHREKVFQGELTYAPSPSQTIELGLHEDASTPWYTPMRTALEELKISNIRLVRRAAKFMHLAMDTVDNKPLRTETFESIARALAMLVYAIHGRGAGGPPLKRIQGRTQINVAAIYGRAEDTRTEEEKEWDRVISDYRLYLHTSMDHTLVHMVQSGFPDKLSMGAAIEELDGNSELHARKQAWRDAWRLYHDTVAENGTAIVEAFERTWPGISETEHATNLQSAAGVLRMLGRPDLATQFIRQWVQERTGARIRQLDEQELHLFRKIDDPEILHEIEAARSQAGELMPAQKAFDMLGESRGYPDDAIASLAAASLDEIINIVDSTVADGLTSTIRKILELRTNHSDPNWVGASQKMQQICELIAARSPLAAHRIKNWFGIEPLTSRRDAD